MKEWSGVKGVRNTHKNQTARGDRRVTAVMREQGLNVFTVVWETPKQACTGKNKE